MHASTNTYIYCFHRTLEAAKKAGFGKYIVKLKNPKSLAISITNQLNGIDGKFFGGIEGVVIEYDKGEERNYTLNSVDLARLVYAQKPQIPFPIEDELRFVLLSKKYYEEDLVIDIGRGLDNSQLIENI